MHCPWFAIMLLLNPDSQGAQLKNGEDSGSEISVIFGGPLYEKEKKGVETPDLIIKLDHKCLLMYSY